MQAKEVTVRLQALDGVWEVGGRDRKRGIMPENVSLTADNWGSATAQFDLRRDPRAVWPDLGAYTPVEIEIGGVVVWSGRISETPSRDAADRVISVQCRGWQYHLDDDLYERAYVHTRLAEWRDARTFLTSDLTKFTTKGSVSNDKGILTIGFPNAAVLTSGERVGVVLDLGPNCTGKRIVATWESSNSTGNLTCYAQAGNSENPLDGTYVAGFSFANNSAGSGTSSGTFSSDKRYVAIWLQATTGFTLAADAWVKLKTLQVFGDTAYESANASILKASTVVLDALETATVLLSTDTTDVTATSFSIPDLVVGEPKTPREVWAAVNAYHDWRTKITVDRRPLFAAKPTAPMFEVGAWSGLELEDQSANSGEEIYNRVIITGTQPDGSPLRVTRNSSDLTAGEREIFPFRDPSGGTGDGWLGVGGSADIDTSTYHSAPSSISVTANSSQSEVGLGLSGSEFQFRRGVTYRFVVMIYRGNLGFALPLAVSAAIGSASASSSLSPSSSTWTPVELTITATEDTRSVDVSILAPMSGTNSATVKMDSVQVFAQGTTVIDSRNFWRTKTLPVSSALTTAAAQQIADLWLAAHRTTPYKGSFKISGDQAVRDPATGDTIPLERLLLHTGELIRDMAAIDPDTGGVGRDGRIASVTYTPATEEATVTLDNSRSSFEALLARFDMLQTSGR